MEKVRADESLSKRETDAFRLAEFLKTSFRAGDFIPINDWYEHEKKLSLERSGRQRIHDLRKDGLVMDYDKARKGYIYGGFLQSGQLNLSLDAA